MVPTFEVTVNGARVAVQVQPDTSLLSFLRDHLGLMGSRFGCGLGMCGACFVQVDGAVVPSCETPLRSAEGKEVVTVEGLADENGALHPVQQAILDHQAAQCGFCISGIAVRAAALLREHPMPDRRTVAEALDRNLCRCGSHQRILDAVMTAGRAST
jgi:nicotinate dehydrogenase subunit A